jgi:hypothetical protein
LTPLEQAIRRLLGFLRSQSIDHMLLGGLAVRLQAIPRPTYDIDLLVAVRTEDVRRVAEAAAAAGFSVPEEHVRGFVDRLAGLSKFSMAVPVGERLVPADLFVLGSEYQRAAFARRVSVPSGDAQEWVASVEDLLLHKLLAHRPRDRADVADLLLVTGPLDVAYLEEWARRLGVEDRLREALREAGRGDFGD